MGASNPDIRNEVDDSRGVLKKLQLLIPGFRGYRQMEDLRVADALLRKQVSAYLETSLSKLQDFRSSLVSSGNYQYLVQLSSDLSRLQQFQGELLHSERGYSGISPAIRIDMQKLNSLYEYDYTFMQGASDMVKLSDMSSVDLSSQADLTKRLSDLEAAIMMMKNGWEQRLLKVEDIKLNPGGSS
jgi:hypothetical protein